MEKTVVLTGDRPTGPLHLGHYVGSLQNRVVLQETHRQFVMIADVQALTDNAKDPGKVRENIWEVALDYLAVGIDPEKSCLFIQSRIPELSEMTLYYLNLVTWNRLKHNPTVKQEIKQKGFGENVPAGFMIYPVSQAADITGFGAEVVPVGEDQLPMIEQTNEIVRHFNRTYHTDILKEAKALVPRTGRLPGTDGNAKMGKSLGNCIYLKDSADEVTKKIKGMLSDPGHLRVEDPGNPEASPVFTYLDVFDTDLEGLEELKARYRLGGVGDSLVKKRLVEVLQEILAPVRSRRESWAKDPALVKEILRKGSEKARAKVCETLEAMKKAMGINYF